MIPELKEFSKRNKEEKLRAENAIFVCNQVENLIKNSSGKTWVPILNLPQKPMTVICRESSINPYGNQGYFYFVAEFTMSMGFRAFPASAGDDIFDFLDSKNIEALV